MPRINCTIFCHSNSEHLQIIYTGFRLLESQSKVNLRYQVIRKASALPIPALSPAELFVEIEGKKQVVFDLADFGEVKTELLGRTDAYFKRSFPIEYSEHPPSGLYPLGLAYHVNESFPSIFELRRSALERTPGQQWQSFTKSLASGLLGTSRRFFRFNINNCYSAPDFSLPPKVIFMCRLWDPDETKPKYREQREQINQMRAECVRSLRAEFGKRFLGGLSHNDYTRKHFPDCLISDPRLTEFKNYIELMKQFPIGIATTGLHNSIGWKFAEYVAFSKAIVSEKLKYFVPELKEGCNYLAFDCADQCVEQTVSLMESKNFREEMMRNNHAHYLNYGRPDVMVWRALNLSLGRETAPISASISPFALE